MARRSRHKDAKDKRDGGTFIAIPRSVIESDAYMGLSAQAKALLIDIFAQYRGDNNGDLCAAWTVMKRRGWKSEETLNNAKKALLRSGLLVETRKGCRPNKCSLYAVTWCTLDYCNGKLDITPQGFPRGAYRGHPAALIRPNKNTSLTTETVVAVC